MLNDKYALESAKLSNMEDILNNIGFLGEEKEEKEGKCPKCGKDPCECDKAGEDQEHKYTKKSGKKSKDYDGDGTVEDETDEYAGVKDRAIKKAMKKESIEFDSILDELTSEDIIFLTDELIEEVVEEFFNEMIEEGFDVECIETLIVESIDSELTILSEAKVTMGHDTEDPTPKEDKLAKVKAAVKKVASGAKKVAKKVAGAAGEVAGAAKAGYQKAAGSSSSSSSSSSGSSSSGGTIPRGTSQKPGFLARAGAALKAGLKKVVGKTARVASKVGDKVATRLGEAIDVGADAGKTIHDFVHSKDPKFAGDSKKKRIDRALGAYYGAKKEEVELMPEELVGTTYEVEMEDGETIIIEKVKMDGKDDNGFKSCWKGYRKAGTKVKGGKEVNDCVKAGYEMEGEEVIYENDQFLEDVEMLADWLHEEGIIENEDQFFELMEDLSEEEIDELYDVVMEATAMAKRGHDEAAIRNKIASKTGGGEAADRATKLENQPTYGNKDKAKQRQNLARKQRGDFRNTTSSSPGLHGYGHKSDDPAVKAKQSARGKQRGALTPNEKKSLNMGYEMIGDSLEEGGLEVRTYSWREVMEQQYARNNPEKYEADQKKKTSKSAMPPRGDKRREDFEKWYAKNVR